MILALLALVVSSAKTVPPSDPRIAYTGRVEFSRPAQAVLSWSGTSFAVRFRGTGLAAKFRGVKSLYNVVVDGVERDPVDLGHQPGERLHPIVSGLKPGLHEVVVTKRTEPVVGIDTLLSLRVEGRLEKASVQPKRRIQFIGNSITCGYGNLDSLKEHPFNHHTEDFTRTYAAIVARELGAQAHAICWSGKGVYRNAGMDTTLAMPILWERTQPTSPKPWNHAWHPDVVVIDLGTNDFAKSAPNPELFLGAFQGFLERIHKVHPDAAIVLLDGPMLNDFWPLAPDGKPIPSLTLMRGHLKLLARALKNQGIRASTLSLSPNSKEVGYGADWHPNQAQNRINAAELTAHLRSTLGW
ncbi:MAG TPA: GDSL-type esterase/lipase family protein [Fibrobacteria bacterium]|nr:GDSL-type esterase/lipase family protein [Fibrobacteria bacterium]HOX50669.1 GDSL-type esterase/lipase family protein [Fibrobacteria bacterium]